MASASKPRSATISAGAALPAASVNAPRARVAAAEPPRSGNGQGSRRWFCMVGGIELRPVTYTRGTEMALDWTDCAGKDELCQIGYAMRILNDTARRWWLRAYVVMPRTRRSNVPRAACSESHVP